MADAYLNIAEEILRLHRTPMRPATILQAAYLLNMLPSHLYGEAQHKTLHARLSEDIATYREESRFFRTGPGVFSLRELMRDPTVSESQKGEYYAPPRRKELKRDLVLSLRLDGIQTYSNCAEVAFSYIEDALSQGSYKYRNIKTITKDREYAVVHSFVVVSRDRQILSYRSGKYSIRSDPLFGRRSIGVGGAVLMDDADMLYNSMFGVVGSGVKELIYSIGLPMKLAEEARYREALRPFSAIYVNGNGRIPNVLYIILKYACPDDFIPAKSALSINDIKWIDPNNPGNNIDDYDNASKYLLEDRRIVRMGFLDGG